jgi:two-component system probable response regulator PhcQ
MENSFDYKKFAIVYVDDEEMSLKYFSRTFGDTYRIFTATSARDGLKIIQERGDEIGILMTDQRMPGEKGVWLLEQTRKLQPQILRILITAFTDMEAAIAAINSGSIYKYVSKPWDRAHLELELKQAMDFFLIQKDREELLKERSALLRERMIANRIGSLGLVAAGLSQHIRNSMVAVKTFLDLVEEQGPSNSLHDPEMVRHVRADIANVVSLLTDLRLVSANHADAAFPDKINLSPALAEILAALQPAFAARRIEVKNQIPENLPALHVDRPKFKRLFELLFKDELAMLPAGSRIALAAAETALDGRPALALTLTDNGPALPQDTVNLVLDPFATRGKPSEYGINLMICLFIVHHHGGTIEVSVAPDGGNVFTLRLPLQPEKVAVG